jgi:hypothetical protein
MPLAFQKVLQSNRWRRLARAQTPEANRVCALGVHKLGPGNFSGRRFRQGVCVPESHRALSPFRDCWGFVIGDDIRRVFAKCQILFVRSH